MPVDLHLEASGTMQQRNGWSSTVWLWFGVIAAAVIVAAVVTFMRRGSR